MVNSRLKFVRLFFSILLLSALLSTATECKWLPQVHGDPAPRPSLAIPNTSSSPKGSTANRSTTTNTILNDESVGTSQNSPDNPGSHAPGTYGASVSRMSPNKDSGLGNAPGQESSKIGELPQPISGNPAIAVQGGSQNSGEEDNGAVFGEEAGGERGASAGVRAEGKR